MTDTSDHDQRFKTLIQEFFADFLALFFAEWAERLDCAAVEWLQQEVFPDPPEGVASKPICRSMTNRSVSFTNWWHRDNLKEYKP